MLEESEKVGGQDGLGDGEEQEEGSLVDSEDEREEENEGQEEKQDGSLS